MNTINLSQFDLGSSSVSSSIGGAIPEKFNIILPSMNILKLKGTDVEMDKIAMQAFLNLLDKYKTTTLVIKSPAPKPKP